MDISAAISGFNGLLQACDYFKDRFRGIIKDKKVLQEFECQIEKFRNEIFRLQNDRQNLFEENVNLKQKIADSETWKSKSEKYALDKTTGGAVVYIYNCEPYHYACPHCFENKQIQILQDMRLSSGNYNCPCCKEKFPIKNQEIIKSISHPIRHYW
jgi:hypothetical protein